MSDYDPTDHTVEEVKAYVEEHPDERQDVLDAEEDGKNRVTLVEWLDKEPDGEEELPTTELKTPEVTPTPEEPPQEEAERRPGDNVPFDPENAFRSP